MTPPHDFLDERGNPCVLGVSRCGGTGRAGTARLPVGTGVTSSTATAVQDLLGRLPQPLLHLGQPAEHRPHLGLHGTDLGGELLPRRPVRVLHIPYDGVELLVGGLSQLDRQLPRRACASGGHCSG